MLVLNNISQTLFPNHSLNKLHHKNFPRCTAFNNLLQIIFGVFSNTASLLSLTPRHHPDGQLAHPFFLSSSTVY